MACNRFSGKPLELVTVQRGHDREPCFSTDENYFTYLQRSNEALREAGDELHG